jgi:hypothetical protein
MQDTGSKRRKSVRMLTKELDGEALAQQADEESNKSMPDEKDRVRDEDDNLF